MADVPAVLADDALSLDELARESASMAVTDEYSPFRNLPNVRARAMLGAYCVTGTVTGAARAARTDVNMHYRWLGLMHDPDGAPVPALPGYPEAFAIAKEMAGDMAEEQARRLALVGWDEPIYWRGDAVGMKRRYSERLIEVLLIGNRPAKYAPIRRSEVSVSGPGGGPLQHQHQVAAVVRTLSDAELASMAGIDAPTMAGALLPAADEGGEGD